MLLKNNIYRNLWTVFLTALLGVFSACNTVLDDPLPASGNHYLTLSRVVINATDNIEYVDIETARVLIFDANGNCVTNQLFGIQGEYDNNNKAYILNFGNAKIDARYGTNHVYVVLNEETGGLTTSLETEGLTKAQMDGIRSGKIPYTELIPVEKDENGKDKELPFVMCVYDQVNVTERVQALNLTGFGDRGTPVYGYGMRRTMAKVVLESIIGGVSPDGTIVGINEKYDYTRTDDQTGSGDLCTIGANGVMNGTDEAKSLALTNEIMIKKIELINVPAKYSWANNESVYNDEDGYNAAMNITEGMANPLGYIDRDWKGSIITNGTVDFTRIDALPALWKHAKNSSSYGFEERYPFSEPWDIDNWTTNGPYYLNSGEFVQYIKDAYGENGNLDYEEGPVVPKNLQLTSTLNPAVWTINTNLGYYIPENIQSQENGKYTSLRIYYTIASIMANVTPEEIQDAINSALDADKVPIVGEDGETLIINKNDNWQAKGVTYIRERGHFVENPTTLRDGKNSKEENVGELNDIEWGIKYDGLETIWTGTGVVIENRPGKYFADESYEEFYIDVPLNNDEYKNTKGEEENWQYDSSTDNNIYRGTEYRVKLYITRQGALQSASSTSRTINIGGEELTITGKVVATPMN